MTTALAILAVVGAIAVGMLCWRALDRRKETAAWTGLVEIAGSARGVFHPGMIRNLPEPAQRYFLFSISPGTPLYGAVEIRMSGELGLGSKEAPGYRTMLAEQILAPPHGLVWRVKAGPIDGSDGITPSTSWTRFWLFGLIPLVRAGGNADHHRSAFGRVVSEGAFWLPSSLLPGDDVAWEAIDAAAARAIVTYGGHRQAVDVSIAEDGRPTRVVIQRWSNANAAKTFEEQPFGGDLSDFREFHGYRLPTRIEGGNFIGTDDYFPFFKARVIDVSIPTG
jgi:hypothetical protein